MHANGLRKIAVGLAVAGDDAARPGHEAEGIEVVDRLEPGLALGELQHEEPAARTQHAQHLAQGAVLVRHVADAEGHGHDIKRVVGKGEHFSIGLDDRAREARLKKALGRRSQASRD